MTYVVVQHPGTRQEQEVEEFRSFSEAMRYLLCATTPDEDDLFDIMKRCPDGSLTTEY